MIRDIVSVSFLVTVVAVLAGCAASQPARPSGPSANAVTGPIAVVAAENFYGDVASQIGRSHVRVTSILSDPNVDPHLYESSVDNAKAVAGARLVIKNGLGYDAFIDKLVAASPSQNRIVIDAATVAGAKEGANPHLWYDPTVMPRVAQAVASALAEIDPASSTDTAAGAQRFQSALQPLQAEIAAAKARSSRAKVLPTEPVFDYMAEALGLDIVDRDGEFQRAVEDGNDPPAQAVAAFRQQLGSRTIKLLIYNSQTETPITSQMRATAQQNGVPVVGVSETQPPGKSFQQWQLEQVQAVEKALG